MSTPPRVAAVDLPPGAVRRSGAWAVGNHDGGPFALSRRCRHQLGDLSQGHLDAEGCLVCPWHQSSYDVRTGRMVREPQGFPAVRRGDEVVVVDEEP